MAIFNCDHYGALSRMIALRYKYHKHEKAILFVPQDNSKTTIYRALEDKKIFDKVIFHDNTIGCLEGNKNRTNQVICDYIQNLLQNAGIDLAAADKVYISPDAFCPFGVFAYNKRIEHFMVESYPGQLNDFNRYEWMVNVGYADRAFSELLRETSALTGDPNLVKMYILDSQRPQDDKFTTHNRAVYVNFTKELSFLPNEVKEKILSIYNIGIDDFSAVDTLILPNSTGVLILKSGLPEEKLPYLYQLVLDYCVTGAGNILIKGHPDGWFDYEGKIPGVVGSLDGKFLIEFIALFHNVRMKNCIAFRSSTAVKIKPYVENSIEIGEGYFSRGLFRKMHQLYAAYSLVESVSNRSIKFHHNRNDRFLKKYLRYAFPKCMSKELASVDPGDLKGHAFTIVVCCPSDRSDSKDAITVQNQPNAYNDVVSVFFNGSSGFDFYDVTDMELLDYVIPVRIAKTAFREDILEDITDEYIYVFSKDTEVRKKIRASSLSKMLYHTGIEIKITPLENSEIDLIKKKICLEDLKNARKEVSNCLTE